MARARAVLATAALLALAGACSTDRILKVNDPDVASPGSIQDKSALPAIEAAAIGDFQLAFTGSGGGANPATEGMVQLSGLFADELFNSETFPDRIAIDQRAIDPANAPTLTTNTLALSRARVSAERAIAAYRSLDPTNARVAESFALAGYSYVFFAEMFCSGVPFTEQDASGNLVYGDPETTAQIYARALQRFDSALAVGGASASYLNLARVGKGRVLLDQGQFAAAAAAVAGVPTSFKYLIAHSENSSREYNGIYNFATLGRRFSVSDAEGVNGLPFRSANDPRVQWQLNPANSGLGFDNATPHYLQLKYPNRSAPGVVASGVEARLIEAEAALQAGDTTAFLSAINAERTAQGLDTLAATAGSAAANRDLLFRERGMSLYLTGHRLGDLRRLARAPYSLPVASVFPSGNYHKGGSYGSDVNFPVPVDEMNNPNFKQCLDRNP